VEHDDHLIEHDMTSSWIFPARRRARPRRKIAEARRDQRNPTVIGPISAAPLGQGARGMTVSTTLPHFAANADSAGRPALREGSRRLANYN
jgi:hypothetical protein